jgi:phosphoglycerate dehydrogenase-like enzyme
VRRINGASAVSIRCPCLLWMKPFKSFRLENKQRQMGRRRNRMQDFAGKIAVITGGGTGMGRALARQLVAEGCNVAMCDVSVEAMA